MPDRQSAYRTARLSIHPHTDLLRCEWSLLALSVRKGVPHGQILDTGTHLSSMPLNSDYAVWRAVQDLAAARLVR